MAMVEFVGGKFSGRVDFGNEMERRETGTVRIGRESGVNKGKRLKQRERKEEAKNNGKKMADLYNLTTKLL